MSRKKAARGAAVLVGLLALPKQEHPCTFTAEP